VIFNPQEIENFLYAVAATSVVLLVGVLFALGLRPVWEWLLELWDGMQ